MTTEATSFIVDLLPSAQSKLTFSKSLAYLEYTLFDKVNRGRKTDYVSLYLANCSQTGNSQDIANVYQVAGFTAPVTSEHACRLIKTAQRLNEETIKTEQEEGSSMLQCLLVASLDLKEEFKKRKMVRQIVIFTDDLDSLDLSDEEVTVFANEIDARLLFVDCRDQEYDADSLKQFTESRWAQLLKAIPNSRFLHINELLNEIMSLKPNVVKPVRIFSGELRLGADVGSISALKKTTDDNDVYSLRIRVEGYPAIKKVSNLNRKNVIRSMTNGKLTYTSVSSIVEYSINANDDESTNDNDGPENFVTVSSNSVTKAFRYGSDYVVLPSILEDKRFYKTVAGIDIRGFMDKSALPKYYMTSESKAIFADTKIGTNADLIAFYALVDTLLENKKVAIGRYVQRNNSEVEMCCLVPLLFSNEDDDESAAKTRVLIINRLPYSEDERVADFPRLTNRKSTSGEKLPVNTKLEQDVDAMMSQFVDSMDIDSQPSVPDNLYYRSITAVSSDTTLPLPNGDKSSRSHYSKTLRANDPLIVPAITIHTQKQILLEWIHQRVVNNFDTELDIPSIPEKLESKITSKAKNNPNLQKTVTDLVSLLGIRRQPTKTEKLELQQHQLKLKQDQVPSLEELLEKGKRD